MNLIQSNLRLDDPLVARRECGRVFQLRRRIARGYRLIAARDEDPSLGSVKLDAVGKVSRDVHGHAICINRVGQEFAMDVPESMRGELRRTPYLNRPGVLGIHPPVSAVHMVRSPPRDHSRSKLLAPQPPRPIEPTLRMHAHLRVVNLRRRSQPCIVVQVFGTGIGGASGPEGSPGSPISTCCNSPMRPLRTSSAAYRNCTVDRCWLPISRIRPDACTVLLRYLPSAIVSDAGFCR